MHYLERTAIKAPECLQNYNYPAQTWDNFGSECKKELRHQLVEMQGIPEDSTAEGAEEYGVRCAYCEGPIRQGGHIEHFRRKNPQHFPELTFARENLFLACGSVRHCGHYKDRPKADPYLADD